MPKKQSWTLCSSHLEEIRKDDKFSVWASFKVRECSNEEEAEDEGRFSLAQDILRESTGISYGEL